MLWQFAQLSDIWQGSVATHLKCGGGIISDIFADFSWFWQ